MIRYKSSKQLSLEGFTLSFGGQVNPNNRRVNWSKVIPWDELADAITKLWIKGMDGLVMTPS